MDSLIMPRMGLAVGRRSFLIGVFVVLLGRLLLSLPWGPAGDLPPPPSDSHIYDSMALELVHGRGFQTDYGNAEFLRPYRAAPRGLYDYLFEPGAGGPYMRTDRPPLMPLLLAATYRVFGRSFTAWRILQCVLLAGGLTFFCSAVWSVFGSRTAVVTAGLLFLSASWPVYCGLHWMLTEPLAATLLALLVWSLVVLSARPANGIAALAGAMLGLLALTRTFYGLWLLPVAVLVFWMVPRRRAVVLTLVFVAATCAVQLPWWIRNSLVLGAFLPYGTQAGDNMYAVAGDAALRHGGRWWPAPAAEARAAFVKELGHDCAQCDRAQLTQELSRGAAIWVRRNPGKALALGWAKVRDTLASNGEAGLVGRLYWLAVVAPVVLWRRRSAVVRGGSVAIAAPILLTLGVIALTWSVGWRFMLPAEPMIAALAAVALVALLFGEGAVGGGAGAPSSCTSWNGR